jgi:FkbM family methyltransferase
LDFRHALRFLYLRSKTFSNWYTLQLMFAGFRKTKGEIRMWDGFKINVKSFNDICVMDEVFIDRVYDVKNIVPKSGVVFDVGAHIGTFSLYAVKFLKARKVYSFEPCPENFAILNANVQSNHLDATIKPIQKAIFGETGSRALFLSEKNDGMHSLYFDNPQAKRLKVECITLKQAFEENHIEHVDCLKLDCEGAEWDILKTIDHETLSKISVITMEYHFKPKDDFVELLMQLGFRVFDVRKELKDKPCIIAARS